MRIVPPSLQAIDLSQIVNLDDLNHIDVTTSHDTFENSAARLSPLSSIRKSLKSIRKYSSDLAKKDTRLKINKLSLKQVDINDNYSLSMDNDSNSVIYSAIQRDLPMYRHFKIGSLDGLSSNPSLVSVVTGVRPSTSKYLLALENSTHGASYIDNGYHEQSLGTLSDYNWHLAPSIADNGEVVMPPYDNDNNFHRAPPLDNGGIDDYVIDKRIDNKVGVRKLKPVLYKKAKLTYKDVMESA